MRALKTGMVELLLLGAMGIVVGFGVNATRSRGAIKPTKNYFSMMPTTRSPMGIDDGSRAATVPPARPDSGGEAAHGVSDSGAVETVGASDGETKAEASPYPVLSPDEVVDLFNDPDTASGLNIFIDARKDKAYLDGHIPGAVQFYPYEVERFFDNVMNRTNGALRVIVYCNGGECTDSKYACRELLEMGLPEDAIFLFAEGWEAWTAKKMPVEKGRGEE